MINRGDGGRIIGTTSQGRQWYYLIYQCMYGSLVTSNQKVWFSSLSLFCTLPLQISPIPQKLSSLQKKKSVFPLLLWTGTTQHSSGFCLTIWYNLLFYFETSSMTIHSLYRPKMIPSYQDISVSTKVHLCCCSLSKILHHLIQLFTTDRLIHYIIN